MIARTCIWALLCSSALAPAAIANDLIETLIPEAATMDPPDWAKPGARIVWWTTAHESALVQGQRKGTAEAGHLELTVVAVHDKKVAATVRKYFAPGGTEQEPPTVGTVWGGLIGGAANQYWVHPRALAALLKQPAMEGVKVGMTQVDVKGKPTKAVAINMKGKFWHFDAQSGVLLNHLDKSTEEDERRTGSRRGYVSQYRAFETVSYPWQGNLPAWAATVKEYTYNGVGIGKSIAGMPETRIPMHAVHTRLGSGPNWLITRLNVRVNGQPSPGHSLVTSGPAMLGSICLAPADLAKLRPGTRIGTNKWAHSVIDVPFVGNQNGKQVVVIREQGKRFELSWQYDLQNGVVVATRFFNPVMSMDYRMTLTGTR